MQFFEKTVFHYFRPQMIAHHLLIATTRMQITCYTTHVYLLHDLHCSLLPLITHFFVFHHFSAISPHRPIHVKSKSSPPLAKAYLPHEFQLFISSKQLLGEVWSDVASSRTPTNSTKRPSPPCPPPPTHLSTNHFYSHTACSQVDLHWALILSLCWLLPNRLSKTVQNFRIVPLIWSLF